ncbi:MAG: MmgE/PrpD family protein [Deltaproteobacteria bacterium]|nr:MAG: MmgE/PrpD family protein [Deltaproteobacteria bacterium]TMQ06081.1 MAG: MmgE/PrpD family protein [Deltaproteobacteria bacterium]
MKRRDLFKSSLAASALAGLAGVTPRARHADAAPSPAAEFPKAPGLTKSVAEFIVNTKYSDIPPDVIELGKKSILDGFGLALAGSVSAMGPLIRQYVKSVAPGVGPASVVGTKVKCHPRFAALANGVSIHADDYDDTQLAVAKDRIYGLLTHPTVPALPPTFALCEMGRRSGKDLMLAYHLGVEVECKIAEAIAPRHYDDGFHTTGTCGAFGSVAASAKLRGLDAKQTAFAIGIAATQGGGFRNNFGSMTKPLHAGHAAEAGTVAADLAALGWTAADNILEAPRGFFQAAGGSFDPQAIVGKLGQPWTFASPGVSIKPHPSGSLTHPAMGEMQRLIHENNLKAADVEKIDLGANHAMMTSLLHHHPTTGLQAKFSMEFSLSILLLERKAGLVEYQDAVVQRADVQDMIKRVNFYIDPEAEQAGLNKMTSLLKIHLKNGKVLSGRAEFAKGSPANPMSYDEVAAKFRGCAEFAKWPSAKTEAVIAAIKSLETAADMTRLSAALTA